MKVLYIGDEKLETNQFFSGAESFQLFNQRVKDYEPFLEALDDVPDVDIDHLGGAETIESFPESTAELLE